MCVTRYAVAGLATLAPGTTLGVTASSPLTMLVMVRSLRVVPRPGNTV